MLRTRSAEVDRLVGAPPIPSPKPAEPSPFEPFDAERFEQVGRVLDPLTRRYFRYNLRGVDRLPERPCLLVGNHSALGTAELLCLAGGWYRHFGVARPASGLMHDFFITAPVVGPFFSAIGAVRASHSNARAAFANGHDVLVFPGGDLDACRPFYKPREVCFGQRRGYVRLAIEANVPVVPLATVGSHYTWLMLPGGALLARLLRADRSFRCERIPLPAGPLLALAAAVAAIAGAVTWPVAALLVAFGLLPTPARISSEMLAPIDVAALTAHLPTMQQRVELGHELIHGALQEAVATMSHD